MTCSLSNIIVHFTESGIKIRPFSLDVRRSRQNDDQFDHVQATITNKAGQHIIDNHVDREPVKIVADDDGNNLYRGWYTTDGVRLGESKSILEIADPREILRTGTIDQEWNKISLESVVNYIFERRQDPHNVLTGVDFPTPKVDTVKAQHLYKDDNFNVEQDPETGQPLWGVADFIKDVNPLQNGDGNFDFREESPYSALIEVTDIWETQLWVDQDGTLKIGHPDLSATVYPGGRGPNNWHISEWNIPENPTPLKAVVLKGKMDQKGGKDNIAEEAWNVITNKKKFQTRAAAGFLDDDDLSEVMVVSGKKETTDPKVLKRMARGAFLEHHTEKNRGNIIINAMVENEIPISQYAGVDIGDRIFVNNFSADCNKLKEGLYDIHSIQHDINGEDGWSITLEVNKAITDGQKFKDRFWYFDPTDPEMTEELVDASAVSL